MMMREARIPEGRSDDARDAGRQLGRGVMRSFRDKLVGGMYEGCTRSKASRCAG
jgi:hypothetical protein